MSGDETLWRRLRDLAWDAMRYRNLHARAIWAEAVGLRVDPAKGDPHDLTKHVRRGEKGRLSGSAYASAEREVRGMWTRDGRRILAGAPISEWHQNSSLSVRGHVRREESGVRLEQRGAGFVLALQAQAHTEPGGSWLRIPLAGGKEIDQYQARALLGMLTWTVPIRKAVVTFRPTRGQALVRLTYDRVIALPDVGARVATLGPLGRTGRLMCRSEQAELDCTHDLASVRQILDHGEGLRRRAAAQLGRFRGGARVRRRVLARLSTSDRVATALHTWTIRLVRWCEAQGVGTLVVVAIGGGDWPAHQFMAQLAYKAADRAIDLRDERSAKAVEPSTDRAIKAETKRIQKRSRQLQTAVRTLRAAQQESQ